MPNYIRFLCLALLSTAIQSRIFAPPARPVYQFIPEVGVENIACRPNGNLVLSIITSPVVYTLNPMQPSPQPELVFEFPEATGMTGLAETNTPDVFAVVAGNWSISGGGFGGVPGSYSVWLMDLRTTYPYNVTRLAAIPQADALNGLAVIQDSTGTILTADSTNGIIYALNPTTRAVNVAFQDDALAPPKNSPFPFGVNGIGIRSVGGKNTLHWANSVRDTYGTVEVGSDGKKKGQVKILANIDLPDTYDDFAIDSQGSAILAVHPNATFRVTLDGTATLFQRSDLLYQPTSSAFGRGSATEEKTLYISTNGLEGKYLPGGQVVAIDDYSPNAWMDDEGYMHHEEDTRLPSNFPAEQRFLGRLEV